MNRLNQVKGMTEMIQSNQSSNSIYILISIYISIYIGKSVSTLAAAAASSRKVVRQTLELPLH